MRIRKAHAGTALLLSLWASPTFGQPIDGPQGAEKAGWEQTGLQYAAAGRAILVNDGLDAEETTTRPAIDPLSATPGVPSIGNELEGACCNGMGGPIEEEPVVVIGHVVDPDGGRRHGLAPTDANLERRYALGPAPSLNPITLRF